MPSFAFGEVEKIGLQNKGDDVMVVVRRRPRSGKPLDWTDTQRVDKPAPLGHNRPVTAPVQRQYRSGPVGQGQDIRVRSGSTFGFYNVNDSRGLEIGELGVLEDEEDTFEETRGRDRQDLPGVLQDMDEEEEEEPHEGAQSGFQTPQPGHRSQQTGFRSQQSQQPGFESQQTGLQNQASGRAGTLLGTPARPPRPATAHPSNGGHQSLNSSPAHVHPEP
ncbi:hypothetical protein T484DRAFT_2263566 [Baffinella frigidus]|nr:hypothetical protein T484DRAFT_2263566 [Cryptophyta sp. CCMP2293]